MFKPGKFLSVLLIASQTSLAFSQTQRPHKQLDIDLKNVLEYPSSPYLGTNLDMPRSQELPEIGDPSGTSFTPTQEKQLGEAFFRSLHGQVEVSEDAEVAEYIQSIGQKLAANSDNPTQSFHFFVVDDNNINAFAGPGGYIGVNSGLMLVTEAESELASVLGHEIAHVTQRHLYQAFQAQGRIQLISMAAMLAGMLIGSKIGGSSNGSQPYCTARNQGCQPSVNAGQGLAMAAMGAGTQAMINFTRDNEAEADNVGMQILSRSEFDPRSMPTFFERMQQSTRFAGHQTPEFLLTHPVTVSRISDSRDRSEKFPYRQFPDSLTYQLIRAKLRVQSLRNPKEAVGYFHGIYNQGTKQQQDVTRYGLALALVANNRAEEGIKLLQELTAEYPYQSHFINALAKSEMDRGSVVKAMEIYATARERFPENSAIRLNYARALLVVKKSEPARRILEELVHGFVTPDIYEMLAQAYSGLGNEAESHRYLGEAYYADGQTNVGILHMKLARKYSGNNFYLNAVIDERLHKFTEEEKERKGEK
ncbi:MAG: M48 family metalloprotease [Candidatus Methylumidiphilus sp.]